MRRIFAWPGFVLLALFLAASLPLFSQQAPDNFRWVDFHSQQDQPVVVWVTRSLAVADWTAIRDIAVQYDSALVVTTQRATPQSAANADSFTIWTASLTDHSYAPLIRGVDLRWLDWMRFTDSGPEEPAALYDNCHECAVNTYFTAFHYDLKSHAWTARWIRNNQGVPMWSSNSPPGVTWSQAYSVFAEPNGREFIATWSHFEYGGNKKPDDYVFRYDLDPFNGLERELPLAGKDATDMESRICVGQGAIADLERGQDSAACAKFKPASERKPVTLPPANNRGQSSVPRVRQ